MSIAKEGFFSPDMAGWIAKNRNENSAWFALADRLRGLSQSMLQQADPRNEPNELTKHLILARAVTSFQSALLLTERGLPADARTIARSFLETTVHYGAALGDPEFHKRLIAADRRHKEKIANPLLCMGQDRSQLTSEQIAALESWLADPDAAKAGSIPIQRLMEEVSLGDIYDTYFRGLSGDAAHTTVLSLGRHVISDSDENVTGTKWGPDLTDTDNTLTTLCTVMFYLLCWVRDGSETNLASTEIEGFWQEYLLLTNA